MRKAPNTSGRREPAMAEAAAGPGGSPGPAAAPSPRGSAGPQENERCPGGANPDTGGAAAGPVSAAHPDLPMNTTPPSSCCKSRNPPRVSPEEEEEEEKEEKPPQEDPPPARRRSWRRSSLQGRRGRRRSLPPVHRDAAQLSQSISLELPEIQRLSLLLLSSFQFCARKLQQLLEESGGFDPEAFAAKVQVTSGGFQRLLQRLLQDGTLGTCLGPPPGESLDPALEGPVAQVKELMASLSQELQAWDRLLQQHQQRSGDTHSSGFPSSGSGFPVSGSGPAPRVPGPRPDYGAIVARQRPLLAALRLRVDEAQQAGRMALEFHRESTNFLKGLSEQLASRTFQKLPGSPVRKLLEQKPPKALPAQGEQ